MKLQGLISAIIGALLSALTYRIFKEKINQRVTYILMSFFRDVGRIKARRRRLAQGGGKSLLLQSELKILLKKDDPLNGIDLNDDNDSQNLYTFSEAELLEFGDGKDGKPILISIFGRV